MKPTVRKLTAVAMAAILAVSLPVERASALHYTGTDSYMSGKYYRNLKQVKLTGDPRRDIVAIARSQAGYQEGSSENQLSGEVLGGVNYTEYGSWYGLQDMWCAMFVSWCAARAGISTDTVPSHCNTPNGLFWFAERGLAYTRAEIQSRKYTPKPGDLVYFKSSRNAKATNHVGIVTGYANNRLYTVEGNVGAAGKLTNGGMVVEKSYPISNTFIVYICSPNYESGSTNIRPDAQQENELLRQQSLRNAVIALETGEAGDYGAVNIDYAGRTMLGCGQWYGAQAVQLLRQIWTEAPDVFTDTEVDLLLSCETLPRLDQAQSELVKQALTSDAGLRIQNEWMDEALEVCTRQAEALGVTDEDSLLLCAALYQLRGNAGAEHLITQAGEAPGKEALLEVIKEREPGLYRTCCLLIE